YSRVIGPAGYPLEPGIHRRAFLCCIRVFLWGFCGYRESGGHRRSPGDGASATGGHKDTPVGPRRPTGDGNGSPGENKNPTGENKNTTGRDPRKSGAHSPGRVNTHRSRGHTAPGTPAPVGDRHLSKAPSLSCGKDGHRVDSGENQVTNTDSRIGARPMKNRPLCRRCVPLGLLMIGLVAFTATARGQVGSDEPARPAGDAGPGTRAGHVLYAHMGVGDDPGGVYVVDLQSFTVDRRGARAGAVYSSGLAATPGGTLITIDRDRNEILHLNCSTGRLLKRVPLDRDYWVSRRGFSFAPDGRLFMVFPGIELRTVDPDTGETTLFLPVSGATRIEALAFAPDGTLYAVGSAGNNRRSRLLFTIDTETGAASQIGAMGVDDVDTLVFGPDGFLYGNDETGSSGTANILRIDPATGAVEQLGDPGLGVQPSGLAFAALPIDCPADLTGDGVVDTQDFLVFLNAW
ncbi:hypothetical protein MNBD_PLANCTO03-999, partial [hydrothermal vent metagenome]